MQYFDQGITRYSFDDVGQFAITFNLLGSDTDRLYAWTNRIIGVHIDIRIESYNNEVLLHCFYPWTIGPGLTWFIYGSI